MEKAIMKFEEIRTKEDAYQYASECHLPKVPFARMYEFNCQDEKKCIKLAIALQSVFDNAKERNQFKIIDLVRITKDFYLAETSAGNFELKFRVKENNVSVKKTERKIVKEVVEKIEPQEVKEVEKVGFSLRLFGKEILGWN